MSKNPKDICYLLVLSGASRMQLRTACIAVAKEPADPTEQHSCSGTSTPFSFLPYFHLRPSEYLLLQHQLGQIYWFFVLFCFQGKCNHFSEATLKNLHRDWKADLVLFFSNPTLSFLVFSFLNSACSECLDTSLR